MTLDASAVVADVGRKSSLKPSICAATSREVGRDPGVDTSRESCLLTGVDILACTRRSRKGVSSGAVREDLRDSGNAPGAALLRASADTRPHLNLQQGRRS